jgi:tetratricopeptide (TPR) repeat protein
MFRVLVPCSFFTLLFLMFCSTSLNAQDARHQQQNALRSMPPLPMVFLDGRLAQPGSPGATSWTGSDDSNGLVPSGTNSNRTVSVADLQMPAAARKEILTSQKKFAAGDLQASADHLAKALKIYPRYPAGHHALGVCYVRLKQFDQALAEFQSARTMDPTLVESFNNEAAMLFTLHRFSESEAAARHALELDPVHKPTRYLLGLSLAAQNQNTAEAMELLRDSRSNYAPARVALADVLLKRGRTEEAITELQNYVNTPGAPDKEKIECNLANLTHAPEAATCRAK